MQPGTQSTTNIRLQKPLCNSCLLEVLIGPVSAQSPGLYQADWLLTSSSLQTIRPNLPSPAFLASEQCGSHSGLQLFS